jgi:hypothetical protein
VDKAPLVDNDLQIEVSVVSALSHARIPVTAVDWSWVPQLDEHQLIVVTSLYDTRGPREAYARILEALSAAGVYQSVPIRKLFVKSPEDPVAQQLVQELRFITEGSIHIVKGMQPNGRPQYSVVFAPYVGSGGAIPSKNLVSEEELRFFLETSLGIDRYYVNHSISELEHKSNTSIFHVQLSLRRAKQLNLAA